MVFVLIVASWRAAEGTRRDAFQLWKRSFGIRGSRPKRLGQCSAEMSRWTETRRLTCPPEGGRYRFEVRDHYWEPG